MTVREVPLVTQRRRSGRSRLQRHGSTLVFVLPAAVLLIVMSAYPVGILVQMSVSAVDISNILTTWPFVGLDNFMRIFGSDVFRAVTLQTVAFVLGVLALTLVGGLLVALALRSSRGFSLVTQTVLILVWTLPPIIVGALWRFLLSSEGVVNTVLTAVHLIPEPVPFLSQPSTALAGVAAVTIWVGVPFAGLVIKSALLDVPEEILDAARMDGANRRQTFVSIQLPIIRPALLILGVLIVVGAFRAFDLIYSMTRGGPGTSSATIPFLGYTTAFQDYEFGDAAAISVVAMVIVAVLAIVYIVASRKENQ